MSKAFTWADVEDDEFTTQPAAPAVEPVVEKKEIKESVKEEKTESSAAPEEGHDQKLVIEFPKQPPYTAYVGNIPYSTYNEDLGNFFEQRGCRVTFAKIAINKETKKKKGFGYVEFRTPEDLRTALTLNGEKLEDRALIINIAKPPAEGTRTAPPRERRPFKSGGYNRDRPPRSEDSKERPKLDLKPRTVVAPPPGTDIPPVADASASGVNPFGEAKPRDEQAILKKKEEERKTREHTAPQEEAKPEAAAEKPQEAQEQKVKNYEHRGERRQFKDHKGKPGQFNKNNNSKPKTNSSGFQMVKGDNKKNATGFKPVKPTTQEAPAAAKKNSLYDALLENDD